MSQVVKVVINIFISIECNSTDWVLGTVLIRDLFIESVGDGRIDKGLIAGELERDISHLSYVTSGIEEGAIVVYFIHVDVCVVTHKL